MARAQNEPARGTHPPDSSPTGSRQGQSGDHKATTRPRAMVRMLQADDGGPPRARPHEPWWHPPFHVPPTGTTDRWQVVENFVARVHCKMRYQRCHPIHSSYPLRDEQILTGRRVTIKYIGGEQPGRPSEDSWIEPSTRESRMNNKIEGRWMAKHSLNCTARRMEQKQRATMWAQGQLGSGLDKSTHSLHTFAFRKT